MLRNVPGVLQEQHRRAARVMRENTAFARDFVHAGAGVPVCTPHLVFSVPQSNRNAEVPCEDTFPLSRKDPQPERGALAAASPELLASQGVRLRRSTPVDCLRWSLAWLRRFASQAARVAALD
jgi:hypothetical protein